MSYVSSGRPGLIWKPCHIFAPVLKRVTTTEAWVSSTNLRGLIGSVDLMREMKELCVRATKTLVDPALPDDTWTSS